jgi:TrpR-related protein YerC/YecD
MAKPQKRERSIAMYEAILQLKDVDECCRFFEDLCAVTELRAIEQRYDVAVLLSQNKVYTDIMEVTSASSATISRVNRMLNYGTGCLANVIEQQLSAADESKPE